MSDRLRRLVESLEDAQVEGTMTKEEAVEIYTENVEQLCNEQKENEDDGT